MTKHKPGKKNWGYNPPRRDGNGATDKVDNAVVELSPAEQARMQLLLRDDPDGFRRAMQEWRKNHRDRTADLGLKNTGVAAGFDFERYTPADLANISFEGVRIADAAIADPELKQYLMDGGAVFKRPTNLVERVKKVEPVLAERVKHVETVSLSKRDCSAVIEPLQLGDRVAFRKRIDELLQANPGKTISLKHPPSPDRDYPERLYYCNLRTFQPDDFNKIALHDVTFVDPNLPQDPKMIDYMLDNGARFTGVVTANQKRYSSMTECCRDLGLRSPEERRQAQGAGQGR